MWLPRVLPHASVKAGTPVAVTPPSTSQHAVRYPVSTHQAAATDIAPTVADDYLRLAAAARQRRDSLRQQQQPIQQQQQKPPTVAVQQQQHFYVDSKQQRLNGQERAPRQQSGTASNSRNNSTYASNATRRPSVLERTSDIQPQHRLQQPQGRPHQQPSNHRQQRVQQHSQQHQQQQQRTDEQQQQQRKSVLFAVGPNQDWSLKTGMAVTWLGTSSGSPSKDRNISCTLVRLPRAVHMVDCGEGSYRQMKKTGVALDQVDTIFITHLHGDHCFGIGSMLISMCKAKRAALEQQQQPDNQQQHQQLSDLDQGPDKLRIVGPPKLAELVTALLVGAGVGRKLDMPVYITELVDDERSAHEWQPLPGCSAGSAFVRRLAPEQLRMHTPWLRGLEQRLSDSGLDWKSHPANTRAYNWLAKPGLLWRIPCQDALVSAAQLQHRIPCWGYVFDELQPHLPPTQQAGRRVVILGDTVDSSAIAPIAYGADLISHEATFAAGMEDKAALAQHSTAWMAGQFAEAIQAKALVLTHFSARYEGSAENVPGHKGGFGVHTGPGAAEAVDQERAAEARAVKALAREAEAHYSGQVLQAIDFFTAHVLQPDEDVAVA